MSKNEINIKRKIRKVLEGTTFTFYKADGKTKATKIEDIAKR